jgi:NADH-quinone oxidoreductase subunit L
VNSNFPLWLIPLFPLLGAITCGGLSLAGARSQRGPAKGFISLIAVMAPILSFVGVILAANALEDNGGSISQTLWGWFATSDLQLSFALLFDHLTSMMLLFVTGIGALIHLYSVGYMWADRGFARFMAYMNLFMFSMIMLVLGGSLPVTFLGWEGVGLCSYLLIGFWYKTTEYNDAARKAFIVNRIGDLGFLIGAFALLKVCSTLDYHQLTEWFSTPANVHALSASPSMMHWLTAAGLLIFLGCTGKSAQIPLLTWLPDAMAGPTPVSALIHAATMVTSGIYLLARLAPMLAHCDPVVLTTVLAVGCLTALFGAVAGLFQNDIKKALAYSTVSQLGYMFMAAGVGAHEVALYHVLTHAFFKATLFLGAGAIIYSLHHEQDMRKMGGLHHLTNHGRKPFYIAWMVLVFAWWAIIGGPGASGLISKDMIMEKVFDAHAMVGSFNIATVVGVVALITAGITAVYMTRVMILTFWSPCRVKPADQVNLPSTPITMVVPLLILGIGSLIIWIIVWDPLPYITNLTMRNYLDPVLDPVHYQAMELAKTTATTLPPESAGNLLVTLAAMLVVGAGVAVAFGLWRKGPTGQTVEENPSTDPVGFGASWTWAFDRVYEWLVVLPVRILCSLIYGVVEWALIPGITWLIVEGSFFLGDGYASAQKSRLRINLMLSLACVALVLWITPLTAWVSSFAWFVRSSLSLLYHLIS